MKKIICFLLCMALIFSQAVVTFAGPGDAGSAQGESAQGESAGNSSGGGSGGGAPDQNYGLANDENSVVVIKNKEAAQLNSDAGTCEMSEGGIINDTSASGLMISGADDQSNGIYISSDDDEAVYTIGGEDLFYDVEGSDRKFNSVINVCGPSEDPDQECWYGVGITTLGGILNVENTYIHTEGYRASAIYTAKGDHETNLVVRDSCLDVDGAEKSFIPDFKLMYGSARATLLLGEDIWFYNTDIVSRDWGAISHDSNTEDIQMYAVNTYAEVNKGGYSLYALNGTENFMYGSELISPQYGMILMGSGLALLDSVDAADEAALTYAEGEDFSDTVTKDGRSVLAGGCNAAVFHVNSGILEPGTLIINNALVTTMPEDIVNRDGEMLSFDLDSYLTAPVKFGESWFYMAECLGSLITTRSHGANIIINEGAELRPANGVILQTMIAYDGDAGNIFHDSTDDREVKDVVMEINTPVSGDVLHQDYQRTMYLNINADYEGSVVTGSILSWNNLWTQGHMAELLQTNKMEGSFDLTDETIANIRSLLVREEDASAYKDIYGIEMTISENNTWTVRGQSSVTSLTLEEGAAVNASEIYTDCVAGADGYLDPETGTAVDSLDAGQYHNVVLIG